jgi:replicative DNA helicase
MTSTRTLLQVLEDADDALSAGRAAAAATWPTGFSPLDDVLGGGLRAGELTLVGGAQGLGKTTFALQIARNVAAAGGAALYVCYEHREQDVLERLLGLELGLHGGLEALTLAQVRRACAVDGDAGGGLLERLGQEPTGVEALQSLTAYAPRLHVATVTGTRTGLDDVRELVRGVRDERPLVVVDYLQKVRVPGDHADEDERVTVVVEGLKDLALETDLPVLAIVASDKAGLDGRTRLHHLRGSTALAYEADVALLLNDKFAVVARHHLMYGTTNAEHYRQWAVCSVEKNRSGRAGVELEFRKRFEHGHLDPAGGFVAEQLVDDRIHVEH